MRKIHQYMRASIVLLSVLFLAVACQPAVFRPTKPIACTLEAKICPDGSSVSRTGPNCEFAPCPIPPRPAPKPSSCEPQGSCSPESDDCPAGTECSGLPAYGCYPIGCPYPICLDSDSYIATPLGEVKITELKEGTQIWTVNQQGQKVSAPILKLSKIPAPPNHQMVKVILADGRQILASPGHPTADGRIFGSLQQGQELDNSKIISAELTPYGKAFTYDLLPASSSGNYWANNVLIGSTLK